jgi:hypothetical protein
MRHIGSHGTPIPQSRGPCYRNVTATAEVALHSSVSASRAPFAAGPYAFIARRQKVNMC